MEEINNYRFMEIGGKFFLTTDHGSYCVLSKEEFDNFRNGKVDDSLRKKLIEKEIILDDSNIGEAVRLMRARNSFLLRGASLHIIVVTLRCSLNCIYCHASSRSEDDMSVDMSKDTARKTVDFIFQTPSNVITIEFQGGEPLLNWDVVKFIVEYAKEKNNLAKKKMIFSIVTNLEEMDEEKLKYIVDNDIRICTSFDGPKELHDSNRPGVRSNYDVVSKWTNILNEEYKKKGVDKEVGALVTLTRESLKYPKEIVDEYVKLGFRGIHLRYLDNLGVAKKTWPSLSYSNQEYLDFWKKAVSYIESLREKGVDIRERIVDLMHRKIAGEMDPNYLDMRSPCGAAIGQLAYNYDGNIYTCDEARMIGEDVFLLGNVKGDSYKDAVCCENACATVNASINDQYICDACVFKPYCGVCPVCNYAYQGNVIGKISETDRCKIFKEQFRWVVAERFINKEKESKDNDRAA